MDAYSSLIVQMAENRVRDLRREAAGRSAGRSAGRRWFRRRPAPAEPLAPVALPVVDEEPDELRRTA